MHEEQGRVMVGHADDLIGWRVIRTEAWKAGVVRLHLVRAPAQDKFLMVYCSDAVLSEHLQRLQEVVGVYGL